MKETPDYEKYPVSAEEMGPRYKNWTDTLARQLVIFYQVGKEVGGEKFVERLKEEFYKIGQKTAEGWLSMTQTSRDEFRDCMALPKLQDFIDDRYANFWNGYVEHTPKAFEKELYTCPVTKPMSREPGLCEILVAESFKGMLAALNPKFKTEGFTELLPKGHRCCRLRVILEE